MNSVVIGPWPGSDRHGLTPGQPLRRPVPHRYKVGKHGPVVLMDCRDCRRPFRPDVEVPRDRLCADCRSDCAVAAPMLDLNGSEGD
ncbi:hypothetical protein IU500_07125 [Nocardia terpenica]|uniref:Uncharacterized protein n=1 Tax=Nocardia terpenica TaxID=455432 RepID=A0A164K235_9NOCA|nr:hypothetical protein [Nocardia terpenica]KZM70950.1 hypothetical protein AWN90_41230 [Nocardia terpenica]MBF6060549.1 hypothetical protein [Nocardia terpenica]MBF6103809.1 hypothetical protein [Nocardia terpenica]MBF6111817.1 hypothetical protein [Nocardia terpenica]MBF6118030.1 hypothetical protein [Nocardia terpenica]